MKFWNFKNVEGSDTEIELRIEGAIAADDDLWIYEWFQVTATSPNLFKQELANHAGKNITVWIDSNGGDVFAAAGIYNALKNHKGNVNVKIDGKAMSAASVIAMAGSEIEMSPVSIMMIHNPLTESAGDARDLRKTADVLDEVKETIINAYQLKTGRARNKIAKMMDDETWMSARTAIGEGFADKMLYTNGQAENSIQNNLLCSAMQIRNSSNDILKSFLERHPLENLENNQENKNEDNETNLAELYNLKNSLNERKKNLC